MPHKTFISYKYSEASNTRDSIVKALGEEAIYYNGETSESPDISNTSTDNIKNKLKNKIHSTSVLIIIISTKILESKWICWEIQYALREQKRGDVNSLPNRIIAVIQNNCGYGWFRNIFSNSDGCSSATYQNKLVYDIINNNRFNLKSKTYACQNCKTVDAWTGSYITYVTEEDFLNNCTEYVEKTYCKDYEKYNLCKTI